jgi:hypothetical protein
MADEHELKHLVRGSGNEISDAKRDIKEAECLGDDEVMR